MLGFIAVSCGVFGCVSGLRSLLVSSTLSTNGHCRAHHSSAMVLVGHSPPLTFGGGETPTDLIK